MVKRTSFIVACSVLLVSLACQTLLGGGTHRAGSATDELFTDADNPINVTVRLDSQMAQSAVISPQGGQLSAQDAAGNRFTLDIPAGALVTDTQITITPASAIDNLPLSNGFVAAVQFQPDGLFLYEDAILTIETVQNIPVANQVLFGYAADGKDLHLAIPGPDFSKIEMRVPHFSGFGLGSGTDTDRKNLSLARTVDHEARIQGQVSEYISTERENELLGTANQENPLDLSEYFDSYYKMVVMPRLQAAESNCANGQLAIQSLESYERLRQSLGKADDPADNGLQQLAALADRVYKKCRQKVIQECQDKVDPRILITFDVANERQRQLLGKAEEQGTPLEEIIEGAYKTCGAAFSVEGQVGDTAVSGTICRLDQPFTLDLVSASGPTGSAHFEPASLTAGTFEDQVSGSGISQNGSGAYQITDLNKPVLDGQGYGCVTAIAVGITNCGDYHIKANLTFIPGGCH